jgi:hypothetical protein
VDRGGGVHEERPLLCDEPTGRLDEGADRGDVRIVGVEAVLHSPLAGVFEVPRQLGEVDGMLLEDVDAPVHECPGQLSPPAARNGGTHRDAGGVDARREVVDLREERDAEALGVRPGCC